ncbi:MAG: CinA family protein [Anaerolineales bacterium]|nr:CinA family protein [Anaerolineales bacterium]
MSAIPDEVRIGELLRQRGLRLAVAESCTGGLIGHRLTNVPGASEYYQGSVTAYAYEAKVRLLGVRWATLEKYGAVSEETVLEMARGVRQALDAEVGLSVSGIAGPGGGMPEKPVGLVWFGLSCAGTEAAWRFIFSGDRLAVKEQAAAQALALLVEFLSGEEVQTGKDKDQAGVGRGLMPIQVRARFRPDGLVIPESFSWRGRDIPVESVGRRWQDEARQRMLVMAPGGRVYELVHDQAQGEWFIRPPRGAALRPT